MICEDCETPQIAECLPDGTYFDETAWAYLAREQTWTYNNSTQSCSVTDVEYEPSGRAGVDPGGNVWIYGFSGVVGTDAVGRKWEASNTVTVSSSMTGLGCGEPASAVLVEMDIRNPDGTWRTVGAAVGDPHVVAGSFSFSIRSWVFGVVVGYGSTSEEATINSRAQVPGLS